MRTTKSLVVVAAWLTATGCMKTQSNQAPQQPVAAATPPTAGAEATQAPPAEPETAMPSEATPSPGAAPSGQQAAGVSAHDLVSATLACSTGPSAASTWMGGSSSSGSSSTARSSIDQDCVQIAGMAGISPQALRTADKSAADSVRKLIDQQAKNENLSGSMRDQLMSLYDKGMSALREKADADAVLSRAASSGAMGGGPGGTTQSGMRAGSSTMMSNLSSSDADKLRTHDDLKELVQFAHGSNGGAVATEAEGLAWLIAAERFMATSQLPPKWKVLAAEPLFDTLLGVPTPSAAKGDVAKIPNNLWSQYVASAARAARESGAGGAAGIGGGAASGSGTTGATSGGTGATTAGGAARPGRTAAPRGATADANNWRQIVMLLEQRMDSLAQQLPPSDLRQSLSSYALELRSEAVGGGPSAPSGAMSPSPSTPRSRGTTTNPPSGGAGPGNQGMPSHGTHRKGSDSQKGGTQGGGATTPGGAAPSGGSGVNSGSGSGTSPAPTTSGGGAAPPPPSGY